MSKPDVFFSSPQEFVAICNVTEIDYSGDEISGVSSCGDCQYYRLDDELRQLLASRKPDFVM